MSIDHEQLERDRGMVSGRWCESTAAARIAKLEYEAELHRRRCRELQAKLDAAKQAQAAKVLPAEARRSIDAMLNGRAKLVDILQLVALTYPDRVVVLSSARKSAAESQDFKYPEVARSLLRRLVTSYWQALVDGQGDALARRAFTTKEFSAGESESVETNKRAQRLRTFRYGPRDVVMNAHLKHGTKDSAAETLRIHFHWDPDDGQLVIGHCGRHLDHA
jgi:hypothetical protein